MTTKITDTAVAVAVAQRAFRDECLERRLLVATGAPGVYGRSAEFEDTLQRVDRFLFADAATDRPEVVRFPPLIPRATFERTGYLKSFPHLAGSVHSFPGGERDHRELLRALERGDDWSASFAPSGVLLTPAACYPVYPTLAGRLPEGGRLVDVSSYCFRHEPSDDVARMQIFRMHEHVRAGDPATLTAWRQTWIERAERLAEALALEARVEAASDPFFGRAGQLLADSQRGQGLKLEVVTPIASAERPTAIVSINYHQEHFGQIFEIETADGAVAHTSCVGFGLERIVLALYRHHGFDRDGWPPRVKKVLDL